MKKKRYILGGLLCATALLGATFFYLKKQDVETPDTLWMTQRNIPEKITLKSYINGNFARQQGDLDKALNDYLKVLQQDPENLRLLQDVYLLAMMQGKIDLILPYLNQLQKIEPPLKMLDYLQIAQAIRQGNTKSALAQLSHTKKHSPLAPLLQSWIYVKLGQKEKALLVLQELNDKKAFHFTKAYQTFLIASYLNDKELKDEALAQMHDKRLPAVGYFQLLKKQVEKHEKWEESNLFQQLKKMEKNYPATAELIQQFSEPELTWDKGLAEIFYFVSADSPDQLSKEEALFLNSIALYLSPDKQLALIWGAELNEVLEFPKIGLNYYEKLKSMNATLWFKKATLLQQSHRTSEALQILKKLYPKNQQNIPLLRQMGQIYLQNNQTQEALKTYFKILNQQPSPLDNDELATIYLLRASIYYQTQETDKMIADLEKANILKPNNPTIQNDLGYNLLLVDKIDEGFKFIQQAFQQQPQSPYILDSLAFAYYKKNQVKTALPFAEKALTLMPQSALVNMHLGEIYEALGRQREALFQYQKALNLKNDLTPDLEKKLTQKTKN